MKIGFFGASNIAFKFVAEEFRLNKNFEITAIASTREESGKLFKEKFGGKYFSTYENLIESNSIDAAYVSLPNSMHFPIAYKLLSKGIHCLIEKPLSTTFLQCSKLTEIAQRNNLALVENFQFQHHNQFKFVLETLSNKTLGEIRSVNVRFGFPMFNDINNIRYSKELDGGALFDAGAYIAKVSNILLESSNLNVSSSISKLSKYDVDMFGSCIVSNEKGVAVLGSWGFDNEYACSLDIWLSSGRLFCNRIFTAHSEVDAIVELTIKGKKEIRIFRDNHFAKSIDNFYKTIYSDNYKQKSYADNLLQVKLIEKIRNINN